MSSSLPALQPTDTAVLGIVRKHFLHAVTLARGFQEAQRDLQLDTLLAPEQLATPASRGGARERLGRLHGVVKEYRDHYCELMARFESELTGVQPPPAPRRGKQSPHQLINVVQQRAVEQAEAFRLREEWAQAARDLVALVDQHAAQIQFEPDALVFEDPELVERWARQNDRLAQVASREADVAAQHRLRMLESAQRLDVRLG